ncbi:hypothetical protein ACVII1_000199 [Bradyrhizobium elkanii]|uniref:Uncharacterized protein n=1 Tax=Bradyrhizobium elkanii TaxID=29448 RepID=A0ABV4EQJ6_BRAEL|nr:hypothetical protein [Bradyrhizobium elkanii]MCP1975935.1 hypothetical protein [Bradyrhizobium elkanii]MCP1984818.1 hypothetical protein [Bradyrhizobium elkanii]MCS3695129.1 hypothetical protein [Bradyrhizobium elkanii]MCS3890828.1 hypothetical protein [Bradyrhizobium elkanii]
MVIGASATLGVLEALRAISKLSLSFLRNSWPRLMGGGDT